MNTASYNITINYDNSQDVESDVSEIMNILLPPGSDNLGHFIDALTDFSAPQFSTWDRIASYVYAVIYVIAGFIALVITWKIARRLIPWVFKKIRKMWGKAWKKVRSKRAKDTKFA